MTGVESFLKHTQLKTYFSYQKKEVENILSMNLHTVDVTAGVDRVLSDIVEVFFDNSGRYFRGITDSLDKLTPYIKILLYDGRIIEQGAFYVMTSKWVQFYLQSKYDETASYYYANIVERLSEDSELRGQDFRSSVPEIFSNDIYSNLLELQKLWLITMYVDASEDYIISI